MNAPLPQKITRALERAAGNNMPPALATMNPAGSYGGGGYGGFLTTIREPYSGAWQQNRECTAATALAFSGVYACVSTIADDVAKIPMLIREITSAGRHEIADTNHDHWASRLFRKPNSYQTRFQFVQQYVVSKLLTGNVYVVFEEDARRVPIAMHLLDPRTVRPYITDDGEVFYGITQSHANGNALARLDPSSDFMISAEDVMHDRMISGFNPLIGVSPLYAAGQSAATGYSIVSNSRSFFVNMSRASGVLTAPGKIGKETADRLASKWKENFSGGNIGQVAVLGDGLKWEALAMTAADAQLIEQLRWSIEDVARVFRVPLYMLGDLSKVTYRNTEQLARNYYSQCLQPHLESIELAFDKFFAFTRTTFCEFDVDGALFRTEMDTRFKSYQTALNAGVLSINEARALEGLRPMKGGEEPRVQMQYIPLSKADGEAPPVAAPAPAPADGAPPADAQQAAQDGAGGDNAGDEGDGNG